MFETTVDVIVVALVELEELDLLYPTTQID